MRREEHAEWWACGAVVRRSEADQRRMRMMFDPKCFEVAEYFLPAGVSQRVKNVLAQDVQDFIETWMRSEADRLAAVAKGPLGKSQYDGVTPEEWAGYEAGNRQPAE